MKILRQNNEGGFTLLDVLVGLAVFAIGILAVSAMQMTAMRGNMSSKRLTEAIVLAQDRIETLAAMPFNDPANPGQLFPLLVDTNGDGAVGLEYDTVDTADQVDPDNPVYGIYDVFWNTDPIINQPADPNNNTVRLRLIIRWDDRGHPKRVAVDYVKPRVI